MEHTGHQLTGYAAALLVEPLIPHPGPPSAIVAVGFVAVAGIGALLPDMDMPRAKAAKLLGPVTMIIAWLVNKLSIIVFEATRTPKDRQGRYPGHRLLTHTALMESAATPACFAFCTHAAMHSVTALNHTAGHCSAHSGFGVSG